MRQTFPITYQDNLKHHLYGGTVLAVLEQYEQATELLETVYVPDLFL